ncbi:ABC transporter permease [Gordonia sp. ABSL11-1]|uniref:ABC transporter permease n=1 Tax=Gordonia sp. ABSL11-1 TaxID=3053924 RepID=UPI00257466E9|nr:ABC transporter permease [Gordonia sp. ABSL11-1]MDL9948122.1 ABC transporter permease [Gordonia sp. ABSL11-1]
MLRYVLLKLATAVGVVWAAYTLSFLLLFALPSDPVTHLFDPNEVQQMTPEDLANLRHYYGFDRPLIIQYVQRLGRAVHGDFGNSVHFGQPVSSLVLHAVPSTLMLAFTSLIVAVIIALVVTVIASYVQRPWLSNLVAAVPAVAVSFPTFLIGLLLLEMFAFRLGMFPAVGNEGLLSLVLPSITLAIPVSAPIAQLLLKNFDEELEKGYMITSIMKGFSRFAALTREVLRNASMSALTIGGIIFGNLLAGAVIVETVFSRPGLGGITETAVRQQDLPLVQGVVVLVAVVFVVVNLIVDLIYPLLDPRLRTVLPLRGNTRVTAS